jgi:glutaredoxin
MLSVIAIVLGLILALIGTIIVWVAAFRQHVIWGLVAVFAPLGKTIFACVHWGEAKGGFLSLSIGMILCIGGAFTIPDLKANLMKQYHHEAGGTQVKEPDLNAQIQEHRQQLETLQGAFAQDGVELTKQYQTLDAQRKALKPGDSGAVTKFNEAAAVYQARNTARKQMQQQIDATQRELETLLDTRSRNPAAAAATGKKVVMYTTSHCPACKAAKQYLAQKGVSYEEIDVETSRDGQQAFQKLGGHGVPLILVGDKRMEGFNSQALDAML